MWRAIGLGLHASNLTRILESEQGPVLASHGPEQERHDRGWAAGAITDAEGRSHKAGPTNLPPQRKTTARTS